MIKNSSMHNKITLFLIEDTIFLECLKLQASGGWVGGDRSEDFLHFLKSRKFKANL